MMKDMSLKPVFVKFVPKKLEQGVLYVSEEFGTAIHLCACGACGQKTVTPFHIAERGWQYTRDALDQVTLHPSIGNYQMPCRSHYWVRENRVEWCS
jgi:hypothetical protein